MMKFILPFILIIACETTEKITIDDDNLIIGKWANAEYSDSTITYHRVSGIPVNEYGFEFRTDGTFIEQKMFGWCGTPPVSYTDYNGNWIQTDSVLAIRVGYWGGMVNYKWKIVSLNNEKLVTIRLSEEYEQDN